MTARAMAGLALVLFSTTAAQAARPLGNVVPQETAQRYGMERAWATQIELDRSRGRVAHISLQAGLVMVQTDQAAVHVLDAETRNTLWIGHVGRPGAVTSPPAASDKYVASTNGGVLYLFDRPTGKVLWTRQLVSVPITGPAISDERVYVPLVTGMISTFRLPAENLDESPSEQKFKDNASNYIGKGIAYEPPIVIRSSTGLTTNIVWGTDAGNVYSVTPDQLLAVYRFKARGAVMAGLMYRAPYIYAASRDGYIYCLRAEKGSAKWQFSIGNPIVETPMATGDGVYVIPESGGLYKLSLETGEEIWEAPGVFKFVAASPTRLYAADSAGQLLILDAKSGARLGGIAAQNLPIKVFNRDNDRVYLATTTGLVQCLHEVALKQPAWHGVTPVTNKDEAESADEAEKPKKTKPAEADDGTDPFGGEEKMPADEGDDAMADESDEAMEDEK